MPKSRFVVAEDQEQVDKIVSVADRLPRLPSCFTTSGAGLRDYDHARLKWIDEVQRIGREKLGS